MKLLLTSSGISNPSIKHALVDLLGKPIAESGALCIPTAIYPFPGGPEMACRMIRGLINETRNSSDFSTYELDGQ